MRSLQLIVLALLATAARADTILIQDLTDSNGFSESVSCTTFSRVISYSCNSFTIQAPDGMRFANSNFSNDLGTAGLGGFLFADTSGEFVVASIGGFGNSTGETTFHFNFNVTTEADRARCQDIGPLFSCVGGGVFPSNGIVFDGIVNWQLLGIPGLVAFDTISIEFDAAPVPEPSSFLLLGSAALVILALPIRGAWRTTHCSVNVT